MRVNFGSLDFSLFSTFVTGINIDIKVDLSDRAVIIAFKETIKTIQG